MPARVAQTPPTAHKPSGMTDCMVECDECCTEWAWGAPYAKCKELASKHNAEFHKTEEK